MNRVRLLLHYLSRQKKAYSVAVFATLATNGIAVVLPRFIRGGVDALAAGIPDSRAFARMLWIMISLALVMGTSRIISRVLFFNGARDIEGCMKRDLLAKLMTLGKPYYDRNPSGAIISRINNDITGVRLLCGFGFFQVINLACSFTLTPIMMWRLSPPLTVACAALAFLVFSLYRLGMIRVRKIYRTQMDRVRQISMFAASALAAIETIKNFMIGFWARREFRRLNRAWLTNGLKLTGWGLALNSLFFNLDIMMKLLVLAYGGLLASRGVLSVGELTAFLAYTALFMAPLGGLNWMFNMLQQSLLGLESIETIFNENPPPRPAAAPAEPSAGQGLEVRNLTYAFPGAERAVLRGVSFRVEPGQVAGILGCIGSGKTTLVNCLNGYLEIAPGHVFLDGRDLAAMPLHDLREKVTSVTQEPFLFSETVEDNIRFLSGVELDEKSFRNLLSGCALEEEVRTFPLQEKTLVGERGIMLSGGQKQRLSLARALARPSALVLLDNVFSAVDYETERRLLDFVYHGRREQSLLVISHRVRALERADVILVLEDGKIADRGTHQELASRPGYYRDTWMLQHSLSPGPDRGGEP